MHTHQNIAALLASHKPYLTDGGLETTLVFHDGVDLPYFASFTELDAEGGIARLDRYFAHYLEAAAAAGTGFVLDTLTWRANAAWGKIMGLDRPAVETINRRAVAYAQGLRDAWQNRVTPILINGVIGPAGDGYAPDEMLSRAAARDIHTIQVNALAAAGADMVSAITMTHTREAIGIIDAAKAADIPVVCSFTVETDGRLPSGQDLASAITETDDATDSGPIYYMINCAHPEHFHDALNKGASWLNRIGGIRANASRMSHEELDAADVLDDGNPDELARDYVGLQSILPQLHVLGGCCGTDHRHIAAISASCIAH